MAIHGRKPKVTHFAFFYNLETPEGRNKYADKLSEILSNDLAQNIVAKEYVKKYEEMGPDKGYKEDQVWKLVEYDIFPEKEKPYTEKRTAEEDIP